MLELELAERSEALLPTTGSKESHMLETPTPPEPEPGNVDPEETPETEEPEEVDEPSEDEPEADPATPEGSAP